MKGFFGDVVRTLVRKSHFAGGANLSDAPADMPNRASLAAVIRDLVTDISGIQHTKPATAAVSAPAAVTVQGSIPAAQNPLATVTGGTTVTDTVAETVSRTLTIATNALTSGKVFKVRFGAYFPSTNGADTARVRLRLGGVAGTILLDSGAIDVANNDFVVGDFEMVATGAPGAAVPVIGYGYICEPSAAGSPIVSGVSLPTNTFATNGALDLVVTIEFSAASADNQGVCNYFHISAPETNTLATDHNLAATDVTNLRATAASLVTLTNELRTNALAAGKTATARSIVSNNAQTYNVNGGKTFAFQLDGVAMSCPITSAIATANATDATAATAAEVVTMLEKAGLNRLGVVPSVSGGTKVALTTSRKGASRTLNTFSGTLETVLDLTGGVATAGTGYESLVGNA